MRRFLFLLVVGWFASALRANDDRWPAQLRADCDYLIESSFHRPYGTAWEAVPTANTTRSLRVGRMVAMKSGESPAAGMLLLLAGKMLDEPKYIDSARSVARAVAASQDSTGMIRSRPMFAASPGGREEPQLVPDRSATVAGLGLLLAILDHAETPDESIKRAAVRATHWLSRQQTQIGGFPTGFPASTAPRDATRIIRLDTRDYRDTTLALFLAAEILEDPQVEKEALRAVEMLLRLQLPARGSGAALWSAAYNADGSFTDASLGFPTGADPLASVHSIQTLLVAQLLAPNVKFGRALDAAAESFEKLQDVPAATGTIATLGRLKASGPRAFKQTINTHFTTRHQLLLSITGATDVPLFDDLPTKREDLAGYLESTKLRWKPADGERPADLSSQVQRISTVLVRFVLDRQAKP